MGVMATNGYFTFPTALELEPSHLMQFSVGPRALGFELGLPIPFPILITFTVRMCVCVYVCLEFFFSLATQTVF